MKSNKKDTELEDLYEPELYREFLLKKGVSIDVNAFKNNSVKWSDRIKAVYTEAGIDYNKDIEDYLKKELSHSLFKSPVKECLTLEGFNLITAILNQVKRDLNYMLDKQ